MQVDFKALFAVIQTPLLVLDRDMIIVAFNPAYSKATGIREADSIGKSHFEVFPENPNDLSGNGRSVVRMSFEKVVRFGVADEMPLVKYDVPVPDSKTGEFDERFWKAVNSPVFGADGSVTHILHYPEDVTLFVQMQNRNLKLQIGQQEIVALKLAQESQILERHKLEAIFSKSPAAMALWRGPEFIFEMVNPQYQASFSGKELIGKKLFEVFPELLNTDYPVRLEKVLNSGESLHLVEELTRVARTTGGPVEDRYFDNSFVRINNPDGSAYGVFNHALDVGDRVLARMNILAAKAEAERANETKSSFLANMSHEIRTPLAAILGFSNLLRDEVLEAEEKSEYLDTIIRNGNALTKIIDDILDLAKVEAGKLEVEIVPVSLHDLSAETIDLFREKIQDKEIYLKLDIAPDVPRSISSDPTRLRQILVNLIGNAVKFTDTGGVTVRIRATPIIENKARIVIDVEDTGIGLADNQRDRLFTPFSQADNSMTRKFGGTGLGLVLSQRLSHALAGEITISQSKAGAGSTFTLVFEASLPDNAIKSDVKSVDKLIDKSLPLLGLKVLAVDDSPDNLLLVQRLLIKNGATVETARDGDEGAMKALAGNFQVVLMDLQMPKMDGYQAKQALDRSGYQQPVIALTAHAMSDERVKTKAAGFAAHLTKPLNAPDLLSTLSAYCEQSQD